MAHTLAAIVVSQFLLCSGALADNVSVAGDQPVINRADCRALATYRPSQGVEYQPGVDVNGHYVAPADLPGNSTYKLPDKVEFDVAVNPIGFAPRNAAGQQNTPQSGPYANTAMAVGHIVVDTHTGAVTMNGKPITDESEQYLADLCRKAGF